MAKQTTWVDVQSYDQMKAAEKALIKVKEAEAKKENAGLIKIPLEIKKGIRVKFMTPQEADEYIKGGGIVPYGVRLIVKKTLKSLNK